MAIRQSPILRVCLLVALAAALADAASLRGAKEIEEAASTDEKETSEDFYQMIIDEPFEEEAEDKEPSLYEKYVEPLFTTHEAPEEGERNLQLFIPQNGLARRPLGVNQGFIPGAQGAVPIDIRGNFGTPVNNRPQTSWWGNYELTNRVPIRGNVGVWNSFTPPVAPVQPVGFRGPVQPVGFRGPVQPVGFRGPVQPVGFRGPVQPVGFRGPVQPVGFGFAQQPGMYQVANFRAPFAGGGGGGGVSGFFGDFSF